MAISFPSDIVELSENLLHDAQRQNYIITAAESCTGGLLMAALTEISGASKTIWQSYLTYHNHAKQEFLNVSFETLQQYGAVSHECAREMANGVLEKQKQSLKQDDAQNSQNILAIAITGIAGNNHDKIDEESGKNVGLVYIGLAKYLSDENAHQGRVSEHHFSGTRNEIRTQTVFHALAEAQEFLAMR